MNERMEQEIKRTIDLLQASLPQQKKQQASLVVLLRIAASEMNVFFLLALFAAVLAFGVASTKFLAMPMVTVFCTAPLPVLLLFHRYVLNGNESMRELEETFRYSYAEMLIARAALISCYMLVVLLCLSAAVQYSVGEGFLRLALCGAVPSLYLCALLLFLSSVKRDPESLSMLALVFWVALCFLSLLLPFNNVLQLCSTGLYAALVIGGVLVYGFSFYKVKTRRNGYAIHMG